MSRSQTMPAIIDNQQALEIADRFGTPVFVYSQKLLEQQADEALRFPNAHGLTVRYAMKANSNATILQIFDKKGIYIDASSGHEAERAIRAGIAPERILLTSQQIPDNLVNLVQRGVQFNACSLHQLEFFGSKLKYSNVSVRINPGLGSGGTKKTNTGGPSSSFGIWHEQLQEVYDTCQRHNLKVRRIHTHIGSGSDPEIWKKVAIKSLNIVNEFIAEGYPISTLNLGGGYKVARMPDEKATDLQECGMHVKDAFVDFFNKPGRNLKLEIEPGTFLTANAGCLVAKVIDIKKTPDYNFLIISAGMTENLRPSLYAAQHPIYVVPRDETKTASETYVVFGHCCESGDLQTPSEDNPETLQPRKLLKANIGDVVIIGGAGAYCSSMSAKNYNSFPEAPEVLLDNKNEPRLIRQRQSLGQMVMNEVPII